jgi:hypothetical protein
MDLRWASAGATVKKIQSIGVVIQESVCQTITVGNASK